MTSNPIRSPREEYLKWISLIFLGLVFLTAYYEIILKTVGSWLQFERSYGLLIFGISLYMLWIRRKQIMAAPIVPAPLLGGVVIFAGAAVLLISKLSNTLMTQGFALIVTALGVVWAVLGIRQVKLFLIPFAYLIFMFSLIEEFLGFFTRGLQQLTAILAASMLSLAGMPVYAHKEFIQLPHITLEVAKVCNGANHIVALVALALPMAVLSKMRTYRKIFFIAFAFFTGLFANGLRVALIGWWTIGHSETSIHGPFEFFYASFIIFFGLLIVGSARLFSGEKAGGWMENSSHRPTARTLWRELKPSAIFSSALLLAAIVLYYSISSTSRGALLNPIYSFPYEVAGYTGRDVSDADWPFKNVTGDQILRRIYIDDLSGRKIGLLVSYFENQAQDKEIVNQRLMWLHLKESQVTIPVESGRIQVNRGVSRGIADQSYSGDHRIFYFFYYIDSGIETSPYLAKSAILRRALLSRLQDGAIIVFSTENGSPVDTGGEAEVVRFIGKAFPLLREHLRTT